jgi:hypothetical protein
MPAIGLPSRTGERPYPRSCFPRPGRSLSVPGAEEKAEVAGVDISRVHEIADDPSLSPQQKIVQLHALTSDVWSLQRAEAGGQSGEVVWDDYLREIREAIERIESGIQERR